MGLKFENSNGYYEINENYIEQIASSEVLKIDGVLSGKKEPDFVDCEITKNNEINLKVFVKLKSGLDLMVICPKIQESIKQTIKSTCDVAVNRIDIEVVGFDCK